jgi:hypothetical protein
VGRIWKLGETDARRDDVKEEEKGKKKIWSREAKVARKEWEEHSERITPNLRTSMVKNQNPTKQKRNKSNRRSLQLTVSVPNSHITVTT